MVYRKRMPRISLVLQSLRTRSLPTIVFLVAGVLPGLHTAPANAGQVQVAVAANFAAPMQALAAGFTAETGHVAVVSVGSTGKFYAQISNGAPFEVLLAADVETPARLAGDGLAIDNTRFTYATGRLVLWSPRAGLVDPGGDVLRTDATSKLAIADQRVAPYGAAAMKALTRLGLVERWRARLVQGDSVGQAYQFAASGNAELGFVSLSQVMKNGKIESGSAWLVPTALYDPLRQDAVLLTPGANNKAARAFLRYLAGEPARAVMRGFGYTH